MYMGKGELYELPQGDAPTYDEVLREELDIARAELGPNASPERLDVLAESIYEQRHLLGESQGLSAQENSPK